MAADSVFPARPSDGCYAPSSEVGFDEVERPLELCAATRGDTTFTVLSDRSRRVLALSRTIRVDSALQDLVHDSIEFSVGSRYEAPRICPLAKDSTETQLRIWRTLDRQIELANLGSDRVILELRTDHPDCPTSPA